MTWTSGVGRACGVLLDAIVRLLALSRINPNVLTLMGLLVNTYAAFLFGYANGDNQRRMFFYAGLVIIGSGFFDLVDGRVARLSNQVTRFGGFFDSIVDRYSDASLFFGLLVFYARGNRFFYLLLTALAMISAIMVSYARARAESLIGIVPRRLHGTPRTPGVADHRRPVQCDGPGALGDRRAFHHHCVPPRPLHLAADHRNGRSRQGCLNFSFEIAGGHGT